MYDNRIVVAMSGGVDSSVSAALLQSEGYDVIGITMSVLGDENHCRCPRDIEDARLICQQLGIPHHVISFAELFKKHIVDYFVSEYLKGRTPNPCALCNPKIKFGELLKKARELNAHYLATGHYATVIQHPVSKRYLLKRGLEGDKDQSYFLARLSQRILSRTLFPIGNFSKEKIRTLAETLGLHVADKEESQEVCFVPDGSISEFIAEYTGYRAEGGPIVDSAGTAVGAHHGIINYTIGQRKGLGIAVGKPLYVTKIDARKNTVFVGDEEELYKKAFFASGAHWIAEDVNEPARLKVKIRYKHEADWAMVFPWGKTKLKVQFDRAQKSITPGQLAVFYKKDIVMGSAWIDQVLD